MSARTVERVGKNGYGASLVVVRENGQARRMELSTLRRQAREKQWREDHSAMLGRTLAGCINGACFIGTITRVCKAHIIVTTRSGAKIKCGGATPESLSMDFQQWDEALKAQNEDRAAAGEAAVEIIP